MKRIVGSGLAAIGILLLFQSFALAEPQVVTCEGKYVMGDLDTKQNAKMLALMEAKRLALEKAGTYVESTSEVKEFQLTKDQINSLAAGIMSVEVLKEDWKTSGENMMIVIQIRATVNTANLKERIDALKDEDQGGEELKSVQSQLATLQKELADLKAKQTEAAPGKEQAVAKEAIKEKHDDIMKEMTALDFMETANAAMMNQRWSEANESYGKALAINPKLTGAYRGQAVALGRMGRTQEADAKMDEALKTGTPTARDYAVKAMILKNQQQYGPALQYINKAIQMQPRVPRFYLQRGDIQLAMHKPKAAFNDYSQACRMGNKIGCEKAKSLKQKMQQQERPRDGRKTPMRRY
jgi:tetratricopeptide (TPR) repeat protein